ncbi:MAG: polyphenol oxidase family protein [Planctomycetes bacterium]|nr:polyphenol oxidase family protein [Planctomycetota bacterium]
MHVQSALLGEISGVRHAFGTLSEPIPEPFRAEWPAAFPTWKQVHGVRIAEARAAREELGACDGLVSFTAGQPIAVTSADCVPILAARDDGRAVAALHSGWRGTLSGASTALVRELARRGEDPARWSAAVGPAIGPCCYEVSLELAQEFEREFARMEAVQAVLRERHLDLPAINAWQLRAAGIGAIEVLRACTRCARDELDKPLYASFRRDGRGQQQRAVIVARRADGFPAGGS